MEKCMKTWLENVWENGLEMSEKWLSKYGQSVIYYCISSNSGQK